METINRNKIIDETYRQILDIETHHDHEIIADSQGTYRWKPNATVTSILSNLDFNSVIALLQNLGYDKNSEVYRKLYRDIGYSLYGYWEVFYWKTNNKFADDYKPNLK